MSSTQPASRCVARFLTTLPDLPRALSRDHNAEDEAEKRRIISSGGRVARLRINGREEGPLRIWMATRDLPGLSMTRAFGDQMGHSIGVIAEPEVTTHEIQPEDRYLVVCTDGGVACVDPVASQRSLLRLLTGLLFLGAAGIVEFMENSEVMDMVHRLASSGAPPHIVAAQLIEEANLRWQENEHGIVDDCTVVVVYLQTRSSAGDQGVATPPLHTPRRSSLPSVMVPGRSTSLPTLYTQPSRLAPGSVQTPLGMLTGSRKSLPASAAALPHIPAAAPAAAPATAAAATSSSKKRMSRGSEPVMTKSRNPLAFFSRRGSKKTSSPSETSEAAVDKGTGAHIDPGNDQLASSSSSPPPPPPPAMPVVPGGLPAVLRRNTSLSLAADQTGGAPGLPTRGPSIHRQASVACPAALPALPWRLPK